MEKIKWWIHPERFIYTGDPVPGCREATAEEIEEHQSEVEPVESEAAE